MMRNKRHFHMCWTFVVVHEDSGSTMKLHERRTSMIVARLTQ